MSDITLVGYLKIFFMFVFLGGILRRWIELRINSFIVRTLLLIVLVGGLSLLGMIEYLVISRQVFLYYVMVCLAVLLGMVLDKKFEDFTTRKAKEKNGKLSK